MGAYDYARVVTHVFAGVNPVNVECHGKDDGGKRTLSLRTDACEVCVYLSQEQWVQLANAVGQILRAEEMDAAMTAADQDADQSPTTKTDRLDGDQYVPREVAGAPYVSCPACGGIAYHAETCPTNKGG